MALNKRKAQKELVKELEKNYLLQRACSKLGLTRSTVYRWMQEDEQFATAVRKAQAIGRRFMSDFVESKLLKNIDNQEQRAIEFWLKNNNAHYRSRETALDRKMEHLEKRLHESQVALAQIGRDSLLKDFIDWQRVGEYLHSPEHQQLKKAFEGINTDASAYDEKNLAQVRKILRAIKLAEYVAQAEDLWRQRPDRLRWRGHVRRAGNYENGHCRRLERALD